jgi:predicted PurR-regulated permease PerM
MRIAAAWSWRLLVVAGLIAVVLFLIVQLRLVVIPFLVAVLLAALFVPFSNWLQSKGWPKWLAVVVNEVGLIAIVGGLVTLVVFQVRGAYADLEAQTLERYDDFKLFLLDSPLQLSEQDINAAVDQGITAIREDSAAFLSGALSIGTTAGHVLAGVILTLFATLFLLIDGRGIWTWVVRLFPKRARTAIIGAGEAGWITLTHFVKVQVFVAAVNAVGIGTGAWIIGLFSGGFPLIIPIAVAVFFGAFIPFVGAIVTGLFAAFVALAYLGPIPALIMLGVVILVQQIEGHVLQPFVIGTVVKVHPLAVVLGVATGGFVAGIAGALFAVPLIAVLNVVVRYIARGEWRINPHPSVADILPPEPRARRVR